MDEIRKPCEECRFPFKITARNSRFCHHCKDLRRKSQRKQSNKNSRGKNPESEASYHINAMRVFQEDLNCSLR